MCLKFFGFIVRHRRAGTRPIVNGTIGELNIQILPFYIIKNRKNDEKDIYIHIDVYKSI